MRYLTSNIAKIFWASLAASLTTAALFVPKLAAAHEAYVLSPEQFQAGLATSGYSALGALRDPDNLKLTLVITVGVLIALALNTLFWRSRFGQLLSSWLMSFKNIASLAVRLAIAVSFFYSALSLSFLGPELHLSALPVPTLMRTLLFAISGMILVGLWTELAAAIGLILFAIGYWYYGSYLTTYLNYLGEIIVLLLFGSRHYSIDKKIFGPLNKLLSYEKYHVTIVRAFYGLALSYAAIEVKFLHPILTETVVRTYHLTQFHWLFPHDPLLVTLGAAISELAIGVFIFIGFQTRFTVLVSVFYITLSLLFFREAVWPHLLLYGISISLILNGPGKLSVDNWLFNKSRARKPA